MVIEVTVEILDLKVVTLRWALVRFGPGVSLALRAFA